MPIEERCGRFGVHVRKDGRRQWLGTFDTREEAERAEFVARQAKPRAKWSLESKGEDTCRNCGGRAVLLHHIVPWGVGPSEAALDDPFFNGLPLCQRCHHGWHSRSVWISRETLRTAEVAFVAGAVGLAWLEAHYPGEGPVDVNRALLEENKALRAELKRYRLRFVRKDR